jgi:hypothetical protein
MKFTLTDFVYWFSIVGFGCGAFLCLYFLLRETGIIPSYASVPATEGRTSSGDFRKKSDWLTSFWSVKRFAKYRFQLKEWGEILLLVLASRLLIVLIANMTLMLFRDGNGNFYQSLSWMWSKWDSPHYLQIVSHGYQNIGEERFFIVFLPLYPLLVRCVAWLFHSNEWAGVAVSHASLVIAGYYLYRLVKLDFNRQTARYAVLLLLFFPFSFFLGAVYTDSLFLALSLMTFYYLRKADWAIAGFCGFLAALTRNFGVLLLIPAVLELLLTTRMFPKLRQSDFSGVKTAGRAIWCLLPIPLGFGVYLLLNKLVAGDWFKFTIYQREHWSNQFGFFAANLVNFMGYAINAKSCDRIAMWIPEMLAMGLGLGLFFYGFYRKIRLSYLVYMLLYLFTCTSVTWLLSGSRYLMGLFPIYLLLAILCRKKNSQFIIMAFSVALLVFFTSAFVMDYYVM